MFLQPINQTYQTNHHQLVIYITQLAVNCFQSVILDHQFITL